jgi:hypothetical protein
MDYFYFLIRHTPFWAIPLLYICLQFGYLYWSKEYRRAAFCFLALTPFIGLSLILYYWLGGPELTVLKIQQFIENWIK